MRKDPMAHPQPNPISSAEQYGLMAAIASGATLRQDVGISQELAREMIRKTPRRLRSKFASELAKKRGRNNPIINPVGSDAFKAGYKYYRTKLKGSVKKWPHILSVNSGEGARAYLKKIGMEGTLDLSPTMMHVPSVRARYDRAKEAYDDFVSGVNASEQDYKDESRKDNPIAVRFANPSAEELTETWHGRAPQEIIDYEEVETHESDAAVLAELEELAIILDNHEDTISIEFGEDPPMLVANVATDTLELLGGDQHLEFGEGWDTTKSEISIGHVYLIAYCTDKHHLEGSSGKPESYEHFFGEEYYKSRGYKVSDYKDTRTQTASDQFFDDILEDGIIEDAIQAGYLPTMVYDTVNEKVRLVGGRYTIEDVGLKD